MPSNSMNPVFEVSLSLSGGTVQTGMRVFDLRSLSCVLACIKAKAFGRVGPKRITFTLYSDRNEVWAGPVRFSIRKEGEAYTESAYNPAFLALMVYYMSVASPKEREDFLTTAKAEMPAQPSTVK